jgi:hypothetical protein
LKGSTKMSPFVFQRGETIVIALDSVSGDPADVTAIVAQLKMLSPGRSSVSPDTPIAASFTVAPHAAQGDVPPGWTMTIAATTSAELATGRYLADARMEVAGGVVVTESVAIHITPSVSA